MRQLIVFVIFCLVAISVQATSIRCGNRLVTPGDSKASVLLRCGRPLLEETTKLLENTRTRKTVRLKPDQKSPDKVIQIQDTLKEIVAVDQWTYDVGKGQFLRILIFKGPTLVAIELGERVD